MEKDDYIRLTAQIAALKKTRRALDSTIAGLTSLLPIRERRPRGKLMIIDPSGKREEFDA